MSEVLRPCMEVMYQEELDALAANDQSPRPTNWRLSPKAVRTFILGSNGKSMELKGKDVVISKKFYGDDALVERCIVTLASSRPLLLIGEPGTAKSYLSELLAAAICNNSRNTIQGSIGLTEDAIKYSWNYALLISKGPIPKALVPAPLYMGLTQGIITRFEEITRAPLEIQDSLISVISDKLMSIPELSSQPYVMAERGFNLIATANTRDKGVNEMSAALKRRFNFETVRPISNIDMEIEVIRSECSRLCVDLPPSLIDNSLISLLATTFRDLRVGKNSAGGKFDKPEAVLSTAEAVQVYHQTAVDAHYYHDDQLQLNTLVKNMCSALVKDKRDDLKVLKSYVKVMAKSPEFSYDELYQEFADQVAKS